MTLGLWVSFAFAQEPSAYVLVDRAARDAGVRFVVDDHPIDGTLPVEMEPGVEFQVLRDDEARVGWVGPGLVYLVQGERRDVRVVKPGVQIAHDRVLVHADEDVVIALAEDIGGGWAPTEGGYLLVGPEVIAALAQAAIPNDGVDIELIPLSEARRYGSVRVRTARANGSTDGAAAGQRAAVRPEKAARKVLRARRTRAVVLPPPPGLRYPALDGHRSADLVGWYCGERSCFVLGADGWARDCRVPDAPEQPDASPEEPPARAMTCAALGAWTSDAAGVTVGSERWIWSDGQLERVGEP